MKTPFARLFSRTPASPDGFSQPQREALLDLLHFCTYADDRLTVAESRTIENELHHCSWQSVVPLEEYAARSVEHVREALAAPGSRAGFLTSVSQRLSSTEAKTRAIGLCKMLLRIDGEFAPEEQSVYAEIEQAFGWPARKTGV